MRVHLYQACWVNAFNWVVQADKTQLACANDCHWLVRDNTHVCWPTANFDTYVSAAAKYWNDWA